MMMGSFIPLFLLLASTATYADVASDVTIRVYFDDRVSVWSKDIYLDQEAQCTQIIFPARQRFAGRAPRIAAIVADSSMSMSQAANPFDFTLYVEDASLLCDPDVDGESYDLQLPYYAPGWSSTTVQGIDTVRRNAGLDPDPSSDSSSDLDDNDYGLGRSVRPDRNMNQNLWNDGYDDDGEERKWPEPEGDLSRPPLLQRFRDYTVDSNPPLYRNLGGRRNAVFGQYDVFPDDENVEFSAQDYEDQAQLQALLYGNQQDNVEIVDETSYASVDKRSFSKRAVYEEPKVPSINALEMVAQAIANSGQPLPADSSDSEAGQPAMFFSGPASFTLYPKKGLFTQQNPHIPYMEVAAAPSDDESLGTYLDTAMNELLTEIYGSDDQL
ncbi:hypothetical protein ABW21_db0201451 [Orbilia brochopaga]|nr:hypothetical protein ABW21_db0201451 [Drechslerella brochopaga]